MKKSSSNVLKYIRMTATIVLYSLIFVSCPQSLSESLNMDLNRKAMDDPFESIRKTYMLSLMNQKGEVELYFTDFTAGSKLTFKSSRDWATASFNGKTIDLADLDLGDSLTEEMEARKTGIIPVITLKFEALDISLTTERNATILMDSDNGVHIALMIFQGDELNDSSDIYFDPLSITRAGLGGHDEGTSPLYYNANKNFSKQNWRNNDYIMIYTEIGDKVDSYGRKGYDSIPLPWNNDFSTANMPQEIIDETTPEAGWELVMNMCGYNAATNVNYFAVYNKYLGTLRIFTYTPELDEKNVKNQIWQVLMSNELAERMSLSYGKPLNFTDTTKLNAAIGQTNRNEFSQIVSPWVQSFNKNGYIEPREGWWCFDLDFSELRPNELNFSMNNMTFQIRSWSEQQTTLSDSVSALIDENLAKGINLDMNQRKFMSNSATGMSGLASAITGSTSGSSTNLSSLVQNLFNSKNTPATPMESLVLLGSCGIGVRSMLNHTTDNTNSGAKFLGGTVNLGINGIVDTLGLTKQSSIVSEIPAPTINVSKFFNIEGTGFGEGVWAIENTPVVYYTEKPFILAEKDAGQTESVNIIPKDGKKGKAPYSVNSGIEQESGVGVITFLDPESVKIKINSDVFPNPESVEVVSFITLTASNGIYGTTSKLRTGFGLDTSIDYSGDNLPIDTSHWKDNQYQNALNTVSMYRFTSPVDGILNANWEHDETPIFQEGNYSDLSKALTICGYMKEINSSVTGFIDPVFCGVKYTGNKGSSSDEYRWVPNSIPDIAVTVCVIIKQDGNEYYYSRKYLPTLEKLDDIAANLDEWKSCMEKSHVEDGINYLNCPELYHKLIQASGDGDTQKNDPDKHSIIVKGSTQYRIDLQNNDWFIDFMTSEPVAPTGYTLTTGENKDLSQNLAPANWTLKAKAKVNDNWTTIATVNGDKRLSTERSKATDYNLDFTGGKWQYFRFEVSNEQQSKALARIREFALK